MISSETIGNYLSRLASRQPTPGGGAAGALSAAQGAALIAMVAHFTTGPKYAEHEALMKRVLTESEALVSAALGIADADERAFAAVIDSYRLPKDSDEEREHRAAAIQDALMAAVKPPRDLIAVATAIVNLGSELVETGNANVISDVAAAAEAARAAAATARVNIEININGISSTGIRSCLDNEIRQANQAIEAAEYLSDRVRKRILP